MFLDGKDLVGTANPLRSAFDIRSRQSRSQLLTNSLSESRIFKANEKRIQLWRRLILSMLPEVPSFYVFSIRLR